MNLIRVRPSYVPPIFTSASSRVRVGFDYDAFSKIGVVPDSWVVISTKASRAFADKAQDIKIGDVVRFTAQYGVRADSDDANMISVSAKVIAPRTPVMDAYSVAAQEVVETYNLDHSVPMPYVGQVFLVAPASISAFETSGSTSDTLKTPSADEVVEKMVAPEAKSAPAPAPPPAGTAPLPTPSASIVSNSTAIYLGLGLAAAALLGLGVLHYWPA